MSTELGGFVETPEAIDGTEEDLEIFNYWLAYDYYGAVVSEDFEALGDDLNDSHTWDSVMSQVQFWLNDTTRTEKDIRDQIDNLYDGSILTYKKRSFIKACEEHGWSELASYLKKKNKIYNIVLNRTKDERKQNL